MIESGDVFQLQLMFDPAYGGIGIQLFDRIGELPEMLDRFESIVARLEKVTDAQIEEVA